MVSCFSKRLVAQKSLWVYFELLLSNFRLFMFGLCLVRQEELNMKIVSNNYIHTKLTFM